MRPLAGENIRAARPAEREENHVIVFSDEIFENRTPLFRTFHVTCRQLVGGTRLRCASLPDCWRSLSAS
jgi:hypothetical protein